MAAAKKVRVCKKCSGFDVSELGGMLGAKEYGTTCIGKCSGRFPELKGKVYGYLNGEFVVCDSKEEFLSKVAAVV